MTIINNYYTKGDTSRLSENFIPLLDSTFREYNSDYLAETEAIAKEFPGGAILDIVWITHAEHERIMEAFKELEPYKEEYERLKKQEHDELAEYNRKIKELSRLTDEALAKQFKKPESDGARPSKASQLTIRPANLLPVIAEDQPPQSQEENQP